MTDTLPGCFSLRRPLPPNKCETCRFREDCQKYVNKDVLKAILGKIAEAKAVLKG